MQQGETSPPPRQTGSTSLEIIKSLLCPRRCVSARVVSVLVHMHALAHPAEQRQHMCTCGDTARRGSINGFPVLGSAGVAPRRHTLTQGVWLSGQCGKASGGREQELGDI